MAGAPILVYSTTLQVRGVAAVMLKAIATGVAVFGLSYAIANLCVAAVYDLDQLSRQPLPQKLPLNVKASQPEVVHQGAYHLWGLSTPAIMSQYVPPIEE